MRYASGNGRSCNGSNVSREEKTTMTTVETFKRGDEVLSRFSGGSIMTVLAVEGLKVRCSGDEDRQYWFDTNLLERYHHSLGPAAAPSLLTTFPELRSS
jgi:hypothetical protein